MATLRLMTPSPAQVRWHARDVRRACHDLARWDATALFKLMIFVTGCGRISFEPSADASTTLACPAGGCVVDHGWSQRFGTQSVDYGFDIALANDEIWLAGFFANTVTFGGPVLTAVGIHDMMLVAFGLDGVHRRSTSFGSTQIDEAYAVSISSGGDIYIGGRANSGISFGAGAITSNGMFDAAVAHLGPTGQHVWSDLVGGPSDDHVANLTVDDASGDVMLTGRFDGSIDFGTVAETGRGLEDGYVARYGPTGTLRWHRVIGGAGIDSAQGLGYASATDTVYVTGAFSDTVDFGTGPRVSAGANDGFVIALDGATGATRWTIQWGSADADGCNNLAVDADGNAYVAGLFRQTISFEGASFTSEGDVDMLLFSVTPDGTIRWANRYGGPGSDRTIHLGLGPHGELVAGGVFSQTAQFGDTVLTSAGATDSLLFALDARSGAPLWARGFGSTDQDEIHGITIDAASRIYATGAFRGTVSFGGLPLTSAGNSDTLLIRLDPRYGPE